MHNNLFQEKQKRKINTLWNRSYAYHKSKTLGLTDQLITRYRNGTKF